MLAANFSEKLNQLSSIGKTSMIETKNGKKKRKRAALPPNIKMSRNERKALRDQILLDKMLKEISGLSAFAYGNLDQIDKKALQNWFVNYKHLNRVNKVS